jgi:Uncharacterized protein conserved in bacteria
MQLNHYLNFQGNTEAAFNFYRSVLGGEFLNVMRYGDMPAEEAFHYPMQICKRLCIFPCRSMNLPC